MKFKFAVLLSLCALSSCGEDEKIEMAPSVEVVKKQQYHVANKVLFSKEGDLCISRFLSILPIPQSNEYQEVSNVKMSNGNVLEDENYGNKICYYEADSFDMSSFTFSTEFDVTPISMRIDLSKIKEIKPYDLSNYEVQRHLGDRGEYIQTSNPYIKNTGDSIWNKSKDVLDYARKCYEHVASKFKYINGNFRTLAQTLSDGGGECGDLTTLVVNLLRYKNIPSRHIICLRLDRGYHVWADFYLEEYGWIPFDVTYKNSNPSGDYFGYYDGACVVMSKDLDYTYGVDLPSSISFLQTYYYWYWWYTGYGTISSRHLVTSKKQVSQ